MRKTIFILLVVIQFFSSFGQTVDSSERVVQVGEVIISTGKFPELKQNVAQQSQIISSKQISDLNAPSTADVLIGSGIAVQKSQQGGGSPMLRGFEASRVLLVIDGVRMNNIIYRAGHLQNIITVDSRILDRIEVLYGPSSTVYGSDALGGVIHMRTKNPVLSGDKKFLSTGNGMFRYGSVNNELTGHLDVSLSGKKFGSLTSFTYSKFGDLRQGANTTDTTSQYWNRSTFVERHYAADSNDTDHDVLMANTNPNVQKFTGFSQYDLLQKFLIRQSSNISHVINFQFSNSGNVPRYDRLTDPGGSGLNSAEWYYGPQRRIMAAYELNWKNLAGTFDDFALGLSYQNIEESRHNRNFGSIWLTSRIEKVQVVGLHAELRKKIKSHDISFGIDGQFNMLKSTAHRTDITADTTKPWDTRYPDGKNNLNNIGLFITHQWFITPKVILSDGLRYNYIGLHSTLTEKSQDFFPLPYNDVKQNHHALSGNLGFVFLPGAGFRVALLGSTGFRAPNVEDLSKIFAPSPGTVVVPNSKLKPEYTANVDLTIGKTFADKVRVEATGYFTQFFNAIVTDKFTFNGADTITYDGTPGRVVANQNKRRAYIAGVSVNFAADITDWFSLTAAMDYTYGRIVTDTTPYPLDHIAPIHGRAGLRAKYKWLSGEFFTVFSGKKKIEDYNLEGEDNQQYATPGGMPCWFTLNAHLSIQPVKYFGMDFGIDNILDTRYRAFASGISAPGRNFFIAARINW